MSSRTDDAGMASSRSHGRRTGRPRQVSDEAIYDAALAVLADAGATGLTLARVAQRVGVTAAAVRQRFGSKRDLLLFVARRRVAETAARFEAARQATTSPLAALEAAFTAELGLVDRPEQIAHLFSAYTELVSDPEVGAAFRDEIAEMTRQTERFLRDAAAAGELREEADRALASVVLAAAEGTMLLWALAPDGDVAARVVGAIRGVVAPHTRARPS